MPGKQFDGIVDFFGREVCKRSRLHVLSPLSRHVRSNQRRKGEAISRPTSSRDLTGGFAFC
jgi:hypothetical protein